MWSAPAAIDTIATKTSMATRRTTITPITSGTSTGVIVGSVTVAADVTLTVAPAGVLTVTSDVEVLGGTVVLSSTGCM